MPRNFSAGCGAAVFFAAFLLFAVQPILGRILVPEFGGSVSVWGTSLAFFTGLLFLGYLFAHWLARGGTRRQRLWFGLALVGAALSVLFFFAARDSLLAVGLKLPSPALQVVASLFLLIGAPFALLGTVSPLIQHWYARATGKDPYQLYALSNAGSLAALLCYPFLIEPLLGLRLETALWSGSFVLLVGLLFFLLTRAPAGEETKSERAPHTIQSQLVWASLAALPTAMLAATTARITQVLAPVPFFWMIPLGLYLISFIAAFRGWGAGISTTVLLILLAFFSFVYFDYNFFDTGIQLVANTALFFFGSLYCHALLFRLRPPASDLTRYYAWISFGGFLGTLIVAFAAPVVFDAFYEFEIGAFLFAGLAIAVSAYQARSWWMRSMAAALAALFIILPGAVILSRTPPLYASRNFYGALEIRMVENVRALFHGTTIHGFQFVDPEFAHEPIYYYWAGSGVARAIAHERALRDPVPLKVGIIGLGSGALAAHCGAGDEYVFYDLDPRMDYIAREHFSYLDYCKNSSVKIGDGRVLLEKERQQGATGNYDLLIVDAFIDDSIPVHLLTKEALGLYLAHLRDDRSMLAIHTSNRHLNLAPVVMRLAVELNLSGIYIYDESPGGLGTKSEWIILSKNAETLQSASLTEAADLPPGPSEHVWTDDYANVLSAVDLQSLSPDEGAGWDGAAKRFKETLLSRFR